MAVSSDAREKWRTGPDNLKLSLSPKKSDGNLSYYGRLGDESDSLQRLGRYNSARNKSHDLPVLDSDRLVPLHSRDRLTKDETEFGQQKLKFTKSSLGSRKVGLPDNASRTISEGDNLDLKLHLYGEKNYVSPRQGRSLELDDTGDSKISDWKIFRKRENYDENLSKPFTPRGETNKGHRLLTDQEDRVDSLRDTASLRSSVRFSDKVDRKLYSLDDDQKQLSEYRDHLKLGDLDAKSSNPLGTENNKQKHKPSSNFGIPATRLEEEKRKKNTLAGVNSWLSTGSLTPGQDSKVMDSHYGTDMLSNDYRTASSRSSLLLHDDHLGQLTALDQEEADAFRASRSGKGDRKASAVKSGIMKLNGKFSGGRRSSPNGDEQNSMKLGDSHSLHDRKRHVLEEDSFKRSVASNGEFTSPRSSRSGFSVQRSSQNLIGDQDDYLKLNMKKTDSNQEYYGDRGVYNSSPPANSHREHDRLDHRKDLHTHSKSPHTPRLSNVGREKSLREKEELISSDGHQPKRLAGLLDEEITKSSTLSHQDHRDTFGSLDLYDRDLQDFDSRNRLQGYRDNRVLSPRDERNESKRLEDLRPSILLDDSNEDKYSNLSGKYSQERVHRPRDLRNIDGTWRSEGGSQRKGQCDHDLVRSQELLLNGDRRNSLVLTNESQKKAMEEEFRELRNAFGRKRSRSQGSGLDAFTGERTMSKYTSRLTADVSGTKYKIVKHLVQLVGFSTAATRDANYAITWNDSFVSLEKISELAAHQRINHFAGMGEICNKDGLVKNFSRMMSHLPADYNFFPRAWVFPEESENFQSHYKDLKKKGKKKVFIARPINRSKETGVRLFEKIEKAPLSDHIVVQEYIDQPLLINRHKFHIRCFVLVTSCDPLRVFLYSDGLVFLSKEPYIDANESNFDQTSIHVTSDSGEKCSFKGLLERLHHNGIDTADLWSAISDVIVKTMILAHPHLYQNYRLCRALKAKEEESVCFEVLGFDFLISREMKPWLLKVNQSPSFSVSDDIDLEMKSGVLEDTLNHVILSLQKTVPKVLSAEAASRVLANLNNSINDGTKMEKRDITEEEKSKLEVAKLLAAIRTEAKAHRFGNSCGRFKQIFPLADKNRLEKYLKLLESAHVYILGQDNRKKHEVKQFLMQKEKDRLQAVIRSDRNAKGNSSATGSKIAKIAIGEELTKKTLKALNETQIIVPGKTEKATAALLAKVRINWKIHKPKLAEFWFVYLDSNRRNEVINIVRNKVHDVARRTWCTSDVDKIQLYRIFCRLFNRLLGNHGRVLWDCFRPKRNPWETIFVKGTSQVTDTEISCCRRIVQMCCDCLCIVYMCTPMHA